MKKNETWHALKKALTEILEQAGGGVVDMGYSLDEGAIKIATQDKLDQETYQAVYDITDLLMEVPIASSQARKLCAPRVRDTGALPTTLRPARAADRHLSYCP